MANDAPYSLAQLAHDIGQSLWQVPQAAASDARQAVAHPGIALGDLVMAFLQGGGAPALRSAAASTGLTRPWPGVYKGPLPEGRTQPFSYKNYKTYDLTPAAEAPPLPMRSEGANPQTAIDSFLNHPIVRALLSQFSAANPSAPPGP